MTRNRFKETLSVLHFNDNKLMPADKNAPNYDRLYKIQPLITDLREIFKTLVPVETCQAIDEQMIPFKGANMARKCMTKKNSKMRIQTLVLSGYLWLRT